MEAKMMIYANAYTAIFAGCLFAVMAVTFQIRLARIRSSALRAHVGRRTSRGILFRTE
jgi:hypothetical protein